MHVLRDKNLQIITAIVVCAVTGGSLVGPILPAMLEPLGLDRPLVFSLFSIILL